MFKRITASYLRRLMLTGGFFLLFMPVFWLMFMPHLEWQYYLGRKAPLTVSTAEGLKDALYRTVTISLPLDTATVTVLNKGRYDEDLSFLCMFKDTSTRAALHITSGPLFEELRAIHQMHSPGNRFSLQNLTNQDVWEKKAAVLWKKEQQALAAALKNQTSFTGRLYSSAGFMNSFDRYYYKGTKELVNALAVMGWPETDSAYKAFFAALAGVKVNHRPVYLLSSEEKTGPAGLIESQFAIFLTGAALSLAFIIFMIMKFSYRTTPLIRALQENRIPQALNLLETGSSLKADSTGCTPLHWASARGNTYAISKLLQAGLDINAPGYRAMTPLMFAAGEGCLDAVKLLLDNKADLYRYDSDGFSAGLYALLTDNQPLIRIFEQAGFDKNKATRDGLSEELLRIFLDKRQR